MSALIYARAERCTDCHACEVACQRVHGASNVFVVPVQGRFAVPLLCRHCDPAPCVSACYAGALVASDGAVTLDATRCTGCGLCLVACPLGVMGRTADGHAVHKCDLCAGRQASGLEPVCTLTCPAGVLSHEGYEAFVGRVQRRAAAELVRAQPLAARR